jgi:hypothetical protein
MLRENVRIGTIRADKINTFTIGWVKTFRETVRFEPNLSRPEFRDVVVDEVRKKPELVKMTTALKFFNGCL